MSEHHFGQIQLKLRQQQQPRKQKHSQDLLQHKDKSKKKSEKNKYNESKRQQQEKDKKEKQEKQGRVSFLQLFRFAQRKDYCLIIIGSIFALLLGANNPVFALLWGLIIDAFLESTPDKRVEKAEQYRNLFFLVALQALICGWIAFGCWVTVSDRMAIKCRKQFMKSLLRKDVAWFDKQDNLLEISSKFNCDAIAFQRATGEKIASMIDLSSIFTVGLIISVVTRSLMAGFILLSFPLIIAAAIIFIFFTYKKKKTFQQHSLKADSSLSQAVLSIKTVKSLNGQYFEQKKYKTYLVLLKNTVWKYGILSGVGMGLFYMVQYLAFAYGFWFGTNCVAGTDICPYQDGDGSSRQIFTPGQGTIVFFALFVGSFNFMQLVPNLQVILEGMYAAKRLYAVIDQEKDGIQAQHVQQQASELKSAQELTVEELGRIRFENVSFCYPKKLSEKSEEFEESEKSQEKQRQYVLRNLSFETQSNKINAFVGQSGSGKSTIIQLIMRFYDPNEGKIYINGVDIKEYDVKTIRKRIGFVGQEPVLFDGTIKENLLVGKPDATDQEIKDALKKAEAWSFVRTLPHKLENNVGYGGNVLSGGQKQRIAIARAILRQPSILILDEATSALDRRNEQKIQKAIDKISVDSRQDNKSFIPQCFDSLQQINFKVLSGITTLTIAHNIKTIAYSDKIFIIEKGRLKEEGTFTSLESFKEYNQKKEYSEKFLSKIIEKQSSQQSFKQKCQQNKVKDQPKDEQQEEGVFYKLCAYTSQNKCLFLIGIICCLLAGAIHPVATIFLAGTVDQQFSIYTTTIKDTNFVASSDFARQIPIDQYTGNAENLLLYLVILALFIFFPFCIQSAFFTKIGQDVTQKIRIQVNNKLLKLPVQFFQTHQNKGGKVATAVGIDTMQVNGLVSSLVSTLLMNFSSILIGMLIAFIFQWRLGFLGLITMPMIVIAGFILMMFYSGYGDNTEEVFREASRLSEEAVLNIKTVYSNNYQKQLQQIYDDKMQEPLNGSCLKGSKIGILFGFSLAIVEVAFGLLFYLGAVIMRDDQNVQFLHVLIAIMAIIWSGWYAGNNFFFMPDVGSSMKSARSLFKILGKKDQYQLQAEKYSGVLIKEPIQGQIQFKNVSFSFKNSKQKTLSNLSFKINKGMKVGFVGMSGCGKSTIMQLIMRFYNVDSGTIFIDGEDINHYDIKHLRSSFGYVTQQPTLFIGSFFDNIRYNEEVDLEQVKESAIKAEAHQFIMKKQKEYQEQVGIKGKKTSGGQKQRVAIARALVKNPKILLLDESTSALDFLTEKRVQENIDKVMKRRTMIAIAHRIETIKNSQKIFVFRKGEIIEEGDYHELTLKKRHFYHLERGFKYE